MIKESEKIPILNKFDDGDKECIVLAKKDWFKLKRAIKTYITLKGWACNSTSMKKCNKAERILYGVLGYDHENQ